MSVEGHKSIQEERGYQSLSHLFQPMIHERSKCFRCDNIVYQYERAGPVHDVIFHKKCFRCWTCGQHLNPKNCWSNQFDAEDKEIYCISHYPKVGAAHVTKEAVGIRQAIAAQNDIKTTNRTSDQVRLPKETEAPLVDNEAVHIKHALRKPKFKQNDADFHKSNIDGNALHIKGALEAQQLQKRYNRKLDKHHYPPYIMKKREELFDLQKKLEKQLQKEEDELLKSFQEQGKHENEKLSQEIEEEWETKLRDLTKKYSSKSKSKIDDGERKAMTLQFENQKKDLAKTMTMKREKKKQHLTLRLREKAQEQTSTMVKRQSAQMLQLFSEMKNELCTELKNELLKGRTEDLNSSDAAADSDLVLPIEDSEQIDQVINELVKAPIATEPPSPHPPSCRKHQLYSDVSVFNDIDDHVIKISETNQGTYTDLIRLLTEHLHSDLEKARAIYRWITVMDLNVMKFDDIVDSDTPMGIMRGIKYGTETYHVLFMRLCSYAGLQCLEIKGHSKSVGYEPGMKILPESFQNTWNVVNIDGDWRLVQCNWGARHLVLNKDKLQEKNNRDHIRYQYDEHYFLTDPDEFIQEFYPNEPEWQLLEKPISLEDFEAMPFVRSIFFHHRMKFERAYKSVLHTNNEGGTNLKLRVPEDLEDSLLFFYQLRSAEKEKHNSTMYKNSSLQDYVFQTMHDNVAVFNIHVPTTGSYYIEIFANKIEENKKFPTSFSFCSPVRLKCTCKFKIICKEIKGKIVPLPSCASGEWGPKKAKRHFGIQQIYPDNMEVVDKENLKGGLLNVNGSAEISFEIPYPLKPLVKLRMNHVDDSFLDQFVSMVVDNKKMVVSLKLPNSGQYGLDLFTPTPSNTDGSQVAHICKYLINCSGVEDPVTIPYLMKIDPESINSVSKEKSWGPTENFPNFKIQTVSHTEPHINVTTTPLQIKLSCPKHIDIAGYMTKEPNIECPDTVLVKRNDSSNIIKLSVSLPENNTYMLSLYAKYKQKDNSDYMNIYNYILHYSGDNNGVLRDSSSVNGNGKSEKSPLLRIFTKKFK
ncbi:hillarin-like [Argonauta hians]